MKIFKNVLMYQMGFGKSFFFTNVLVFFNQSEKQNKNTSPFSPLRDLLTFLLI